MPDVQLRLRANDRHFSSIAASVFLTLLFASTAAAGYRGLMTSQRDVESEIARVTARCLKVAQDLGPRPVVEALWDGDTQGWFLDLYVSGIGQRRHAVLLSYGGDIRLFTGEVPAWPEAQVALAVLDRLAAEHDFVAWFPSPEHPDDNCPSYEARNEGTACSGCGKLTLPPTMPYRPVDLCHSCHSDQEARERAAKQRAQLSEPRAPRTRRSVTYSIDGPSERGGSGMVSDIDGSFEWLPMVQCLLAVAPEFADFERDQFVPSDVMKRVIAHAKQRVAELLEELGETPLPERYRADPVVWEGNTYHLFRIGWEHEAVRDMIRFAKSADVAGATLTVYSNRGIGLRESTLLADINGNGGSMTRTDIVAQWFEAFGGLDAVETTLDHIEQLNCLKLSGESLVVTDKGRSGLFREDE